VGKLGSLLIECATSEQTLDGDPKHGDCTGDTQIRNIIKILNNKKITKIFILKDIEKNF